MTASEEAKPRRQQPKGTKVRGDVIEVVDISA
jgi:hypothetical protein